VVDQDLPTDENEQPAHSGDTRSPSWLRAVWWCLVVLFGALVVGCVTGAIRAAVDGELDRLLMFVVVGIFQSGFFVGSLIAARGGNPLEDSGLPRTRG
jgi:hypothetical protein